MAYGFHSSTSFVEANALFELETDMTRFDDFTNVLGFYLTAWGDKPLSDEQLSKIAEDAAQVARSLLSDQVYNRSDAWWQTGDLLRSIHADDKGGSINIYSDARAINGYPYAGSVEYGFHPHGGGVFVQPRPFLRPALEFAVNATRASWENNVKALEDALRDNKLNLSHFNGRTDIGASRRNWGRNLSSHINNSSLKSLRDSTTTGRQRGKYSHEKNQERYGTERQAYRSIWDID